MLLIENPLNSSELVFPVLECFHIVGFALSVGTVMIVNFRLLGMGLTQETPAQLWKDTQWWTLGGLILMVFSGLLLFSSDPDNYYLNYAFLLKMVFLIAVIVYNYTKVRTTGGFQSAAQGREKASRSRRWCCGLVLCSAESSLDS